MVPHPYPAGWFNASSAQPGANSTENCVTSFGDSDVTGIGARIAAYMLSVNFLLLFWHGKGNLSKPARNQFMVGAALLHCVNLYYAYLGTLDIYVLAILINQVLLATGVQFVHLLKNPRAPSDRLCFTVNVGFASLEFIFAYFANSWIDRNRNLCPDMVLTVRATQRSRLHATFPLLIFASLLAIADYAIYHFDGWYCRRTHGHLGCRPRCLTWCWDHPSPQKNVCLVLAASGLAYSVIAMEWITIRDFHLYASQFQQLSSTEDDWGTGQLTALGAAAICCVHTLKLWLGSLAVRTKLARRLDIFAASRPGSARVSVLRRLIKFFNLSYKAKGKKSPPARSHRNDSSTAAITTSSDVQDSSVRLQRVIHPDGGTINVASDVKTKSGDLGLVSLSDSPPRALGNGNGRNRKPTSV